MEWFGDQPLGVDVRRLPARLAIDHHATEGCERLQGSRQRHPAGHLEEQIRTATPSQPTNRSRPARIGVVDGLVGTKLTGPGAFRAIAGQAENFRCPEELRQLDGERSDASGCRFDCDRLARRKPAGVSQYKRCRQALHHQGSGLDRRETRGERHDASSGRRYVLRISAPFGRREDRSADGRSLDAGAMRCDGAGDFDPGYVRRRRRLGIWIAVAPHRVRVVDAGRFDADQELARPRGRDRDVL
jgi:hypothetical protein